MRGKLFSRFPNGPVCSFGSLHGQNNTVNWKNNFSLHFIRTEKVATKLKGKVPSLADLTELKRAHWRYLAKDVFNFIIKQTKLGVQVDF